MRETPDSAESRRPVPIPHRPPLTGAIRHPAPSGAATKGSQSRALLRAPGSSAA